MIDWIRISRTMKADPKVLAIADALNIRVAEAGGLLQFLFAEMAAQAPDGRIGHLPNLTLEQWCGWEGKRGKLAPLVRELLLDADGVVTAWEKYNGAALRASAAATERQRRHREKSRGHPEPVTRDITRDVSVTSLVDGTVTGRDGDGRASAPDGDLPAIPRAGAGEDDAVPSAALPPMPSTPPAVEQLFARAYGQAPPKRQQDVRLQLLATLSDRGAKISRGAFARAVDVGHLAEACAYVDRQLQHGEITNPDVAVVLVLRRLRETWPERQAAHDKAQLQAQERSRGRSSATPLGALIPDQIRRPA